MRSQLGLICSFAVLALTACTTIAPFDLAAYEKVTSAKAAALALISESTEDYGSHVSEVKAVSLIISQAYEYDKGRPKNQVTTAMWDKLLSNDGGLWGTFLVRWKEKGSFKPDAVALRKTQVGKGFDLISALEIGKNPSPGNSPPP